jgi:hypothetical protein
VLVARCCMIYGFQGTMLELVIAISLALIRRRKRRQVHFGTLLYSYAGLVDSSIHSTTASAPTAI